MDYSGAAYAKMHAADAGSIALAGETDFGARKIYMLAAPAGAAKSDFTRLLSETLIPLGIFLGREPALFAGDDVRGLQSAGVPVISMRQNGLDYFDIHHTADDTFDKIEPLELAQNIAAWAAMAYLAAETDTDFRALAAAPR
jgi:carboxypeptidase Q